MRLAFAALALLFSAPAWADDCQNAQSQIQLDDCAAKALSDADKKLNEAYQKIEKRLAGDPDTKKLLVTAQRAWVAFRDAECTFQSSGVAGGSIYPMTFSNCQAALTNARLQDFQTYLSCQEGDDSCPVPAQ
ncbi:lysozyme inhibitor LprI family protein [Mesorhizobium sp. IMUNJ 23232]|uniref:lysozyme inhibitor LprI family protein n=1 Tax=Mesorhizobium sp. IMUNJ 23232 TaxID=3376064 RepID=UPI0037952244